MKDHLEIELEHPGYLSPLALRESNDRRALAVSFFAASVFSAEDEDTKSTPPWSAASAPVRAIEPLPAEDSGAPQPGQGAAQNFIVPTFYGPGPGNRSSILSCLGDGWYVGSDGAHGWTWSKGYRSQVLMPGTDSPGPHLLWLQIGALLPKERALVPKEFLFQEFTIFLEGVALGRYRCYADETVLVVPIPAELLRGKPEVVLEFDLPTPRRPCDIGRGSDQRLLAIKLTHMQCVTPPAHLTWLASGRHDDGDHLSPKASSGRFLDVAPEMLSREVLSELNMSPAGLLRAFEGLGDNCEFGIAMRMLEFEPLQLFRFGSARMSGLLRGMADDFAALDEPSAVRAVVLPDSPEYRVEVARYGLYWHTLTSPHEVDSDTVLAEQTTRLRYLKRKFLEGLRSSRKIYVVKRGIDREPSVSFEEASVVLLELSKFGRNSLLYVTCDGRQRSGTVELLGPGLMRGHLTKFASGHDLEDTDPTEWLRLLANAWLLDTQYNTSFRSPSG